MATVMEVCDVCGQLKPVRWCGVCHAWLCDTCRVNPLARARAAGQRIAAQIF